MMRQGSGPPRLGPTARRSRSTGALALQDETSRPITPLPIDAVERIHFQLVGGLTVDAAGLECLRGLTRDESLEYIELHRRGLDNDDVSFLRYILLGDRHAVAIARTGG